MNSIEIGAFELSTKEMKNRWADMVEEDEEMSKSAPPCLAATSSAVGLAATAVSPSEWSGQPVMMPQQNTVMPPQPTASRRQSAVMPFSPAGSVAVNNGRFSVEKEGPEKMAGEIQAGTSPQSIVQAASSPGPLMSGSPNGGSPLKSVSNGPSSHVIYNESGVAKKPTLEETIAFGGIKETTTLGIRSSGRLRAEPNADATQMERAMLIAQRRDELHTSGYSTGYALDSTMGILTPSGSAGPHGYWMQPDAYGCT